MISSTPTVASVEIERVESDGKNIRVLLSITPAALSRAIGRDALSLGFTDPYEKLRTLHYIYLVCETELRRLEAIEEIKKNSKGMVK